VEQAPSPIARDGQDKLVVRAEGDARHGEGVALERLAKWPEVLRVVDMNCGVLRSCRLARRCKQLVRRGDGDGDGLELSRGYHPGVH